MSVLIPEPGLVSRILRLGTGLAFVVSSLGAQPHSPAPFHLANWQTQDGLPSNKITSVVQTRDGYLWVGTYEGLVRFDGVRFVAVSHPRDHGRVDTSVTALYAAPDATLWIGHESGALTSYRDGKFNFHEVSEECRGVQILNIAADSKGDVWSLNVAGVLVRVRDGKILRPESGDSRGIFSMVRATDGMLWIGCRGKLSSFDGEKLSVVPLSGDGNEFVHGLCTRRAGGIWVVAGEHLWTYDSGQWSGSFGRVETGLASLVRMVELSDGRLIAGTLEDGALLIQPQPFSQIRLWRETGFPSDWVQSAWQDHEGNLWIATGTSGLFRMRDQRIRMLRPPDHWQGRTVQSGWQDGSGEIWVGTEGAGVYRYAKDKWIHYGREAGLENLYVWTVCEDSDGTLFAGTWGYGIYRWTGARFVRAENTEQLGIPATALTPSRRGGILVGSQDGVFRYHHQTITWLETDAVHRLKDIRHVLEEENGVVWVACNGDGLGRIEGGVARRFLPRDGLPSAYLRSLCKTSDGALWIGTRGAGLCRLKDGKFSTLTRAHGLINDTISHIQEDGRGSLWIGTHGGIMGVSLNELNACAEGTVARINPYSYGVNDGLLTLTCSGALQPAGFKTRGDELVFATSRGLAQLNPSQVAINDKAPPVHIETVRVGDRVVWESGAPTSVVEIGPGPQRIEIKYTALSFAAPERVIFRQRLIGRDQEVVGEGPERSVVYNLVPPGAYTFRVTASNSDNTWNHSGDSVEIVVKPHFWQTRWFRALALMALLGSVTAAAWSAARRRLKRKLERLERAAAIQAERARIAHEMHDDLGAHLTRITMLSDAARSELDEPEVLKQGLEQIYETARNVTRSMDEIVWAVNPRHDTLESLVCYLEKFAQDFLRGAGVSVRLDLPLDYADWNPSSDVRHNLFLCFKEALNNVVRHSHADTVMITLRVSETSCILEVRDNGRGPGDSGPEPNASRARGGNGLENMRFRMEKIGGQCLIQTEPGKGFAVVLRLPVVNGTIQVNRSI